MFSNLFKRVFGSSNDRFVKKLDKEVALINAFESDFEKLSDKALQAKTDEFKDRLQQGATLDDLLPEAFAVVREVSKRTLGMRHFDVQMKGGIVLHRGMISEMKTGEGKTLVATLPVYLNALEGKGVHVITVNDYLVKRDAEGMGKIYNFLGMTVGTIVHDLADHERQDHYNCDITYGTNHEFGFDYLRDNMKFSMEEMVQRPFHYAIVDEVDSILVDEARTPLIISGPAEDSSELYHVIDDLMSTLTPEHYEKDEKSKSVMLTEAGQEHIEQTLTAMGALNGASLYDIQNISYVHHVNQALKAHINFQRNTDYIVKDNKVIIIDEFTGRMMDGRRYSDGLHQALEAKEKVEIQVENQTLASVTYQNYFRLYPKLSGMTGTALTEAEEFGDIYKLEVAEIPTNVKVMRKDYDDEVYRTIREKNEAIIKLIHECSNRGQPVLVGTVSIEKSEQLSALLKSRDIPHKVLNARFHEQEAGIIAQAGAPGSITIATNMAGRGTDIKLGGNLEMRLHEETDSTMSPEALAQKEREIAAEINVLSKKAKEAGGLYVIGTERHESRRIDNQLRGRTGRQGDPGASKFFLSLEDDLMRIFGSERLDSWLQKLGLQEGEAIIHPWINRALEKAQQKVEARNYDIRKHLLKYDDIMNDQRKAVYGQRKETIAEGDISELIVDMRYHVADDLIQRTIPENAYAEQWDIAALTDDVRRLFNLDLPFKAWAEEDGIAEQEIRTRLMDAINTQMSAKEESYGPDMMRMAEKSLFLRILDQTWKDHLLHLDHLRQGINLRAYGQKDPLNEYKREAFSMFEDMLVRFREHVISVLSHLQIQAPSMAQLQDILEDDNDLPKKAIFTHADEQGHLVQEPIKPKRTRAKKVVTDQAVDDSAPSNIPRNASCPCESGKRFKDCHGKLTKDA